jgi:hypothetical protein
MKSEQERIKARIAKCERRIARGGSSAEVAKAQLERLQHILQLREQEAR